MNYTKYLFPIFFIIFLLSGSFIYSQNINDNKIIKKIEKKLTKNSNDFIDKLSEKQIKLDSFHVDKESKILKFYFNPNLLFLPVREDTIKKIKLAFQKKLGKKFAKYSISLFSGGQNIENYIPNIYRNERIDSSRIRKSNSAGNPIIRQKYLLKPVNGLYQRNIALWPSHGRYYEAKLDRWEWQRARLHSTVEDLLPMTFVLDYLAPMLENAGATVFIPRERDFNTNEVIVDNDLSSNSSKIIYTKGVKIDTMKFGFKYQDTISSNTNPFKSGTYLQINTRGNDSLIYIAKIPESGEYGVYISYGKIDNKNVKYTVEYSGGIKEFIIGQNQGFGTWIYLGKFYFDSIALVKISGNKPFTADAIKLGGGMGNVARRPSEAIASNQWSLNNDNKNPLGEQTVNPNDFNWKLSGLPRFMEGARYFLQYSGMPDTSVYSLTNGKNDYNDDYQSRPEWVNYLNGNNENPFRENEPGLNIPIDASLAFHTDAGVAFGDTIIGTLAIYSSEKPDKTFPSGQSKMANRDLADIVQSTIVNDISVNYNIDWTRRDMWNRTYSEAWRQNVPSFLLELLSHQNLNDMSYALDPRFKFVVSRAVYKGLLKFVAYQNNEDFIVAPLPVDHFRIEKISGKKIRLSWAPVQDKLEVTASPEGFIIYQRKEGQGFDQGRITIDTSYEVELEDQDKIYSFKITAVNKGGESFPSEILSVASSSKSNCNVLIVNAFDRLSAPGVLKASDHEGFSFIDDAGVADKHNPGMIGLPYNFNRNYEWKDDDDPGWGASFSDMEGKMIAGNTFDYPFIHGQSIIRSGCSFTSMSDEAFKMSKTENGEFDFIDIIFGKEKTTKPVLSFSNDNYRVFDEGMKKKISELKNTNFLISGSYLGYDSHINEDTLTNNFIAKNLHFRWRTNHASRSGNVMNTDMVKKDFAGSYSFNTDFNENYYIVESPDGLEPADDKTMTFLRYSDSGVSAGTLYKGANIVISFGFPFEAVDSEQERDEFMRQVVEMMRGE